MSTAKQKDPSDRRHRRWEIGILIFAFLASFSCVFSSAVLSLALQGKDSLPTTIEAQNRANYADDGGVWQFGGLKADIIEEAVKDSHALQKEPEQSGAGSDPVAIVAIPTNMLPTAVSIIYPTATVMATATTGETAPPTPTPMPTSTATHTPTAIATPTAAATPYPTWTATAMATAVATFTVAPTATPTAVPTAIPTAKPTNPPPNTPTSTPLPTYTPTAVATATDTPTSTATPTQTPTPTLTPTPGMPQPIAYWTFDEGSGTIANDSMGSYTGVITGATWIAGYDGGSALYFDGLDNYIEVGGADISGDWTAVMWVRRNADTIGGVLFGSLDYALKLEQWPYLYSVGITRFELFDYSYNYTAPLGQWVHLAFVGTATETQLYVNGALQDTLPVSIDMPMYYIGSRGPLRPDDYLTGILDEAIVYDQALSAAQIATIYSSYPPP